MVSFLYKWYWLIFCSCFVVKCCVIGEKSARRFIEDGWISKVILTMDCTISICCFRVGISDNNPATSSSSASSLPGKKISKIRRENYRTIRFITILCALVKDKYSMSGSARISAPGICFGIFPIVIYSLASQMLKGGCYLDPNCR